MAQQDFLETLKEIVDQLLPELTPAEASLYLYLFRHSYLKDETSEVRVGKRTIAAGYGKGMRGRQTDFEHMATLLAALAKKNCITIGDTNREGTRYVVRFPREIPMVVAKIETVRVDAQEENYFTDSKKWAEIFARDNWVCRYCGERITEKNATLDHYLPRSKGGTNDKANLKTCCLVCNGIKSGRSYEEAAPDLLNRIAQQRAQAGEA